MDKKLPDNITIKGLRRLREAYKDFFGSKIAVSVDMELFHHIYRDIEEKLTIWWSGCKSVIHFLSTKEAHEHLNKLKKEKANGNIEDSL